MAEILYGKPVADALDAETAERAEALRARSVMPTLATIRVGENPSDAAYERSMAKRAEALGIAVESHRLPAIAATDEIAAIIADVNGNAAIHGCLLLRPLPASIDEAYLCNDLLPAKDIDGIGDQSLASVFMASHRGFPPATAQACVEMLDHYGIPIEGRHVTVVGRSFVIGLPVGQLLLQRHATVTQCHSRTTDLPKHMRAADIVICASGRPRAYGADCFRADGTQTVLDVGINFDAEGTMCGDVDFDAVEPLVGAITPVPRGIGSITTSVTMRHVVESAEAQTAAVSE